MKSIISIVVFIVSFPVLSLAQSTSDWWYFGQNAGVHFTANGPVADTNGALWTSEGCSAVSDENGDLLFYTDGSLVFDHTHTQMPNGFGLFGNLSASNSSVIVPMPGSNDEYFIATVDQGGAFGQGMYYSKVDMTLNGGNGDVDTAEKNVFLADSVAEKLVAVRAGSKYWIISHKVNSDEMLAYEVTGAGVNTTPVITHTGHTNNNGFGYCMAASPEGDRLATSFFDQDSIFLYDFDLSTGVVTNTMKIGSSHSGGILYGFSFSPSGNLLYCQPFGFCTVLQYDLTLGSAAAITNSETTVANAGSGGGALQLGPDGKLYIARVNNSFLSVINQPDVVGIGCDFDTIGVDLANRNCVFGLPNFIKLGSAASFTYEGECEGEPTVFTTNLNNVDSVEWDFGDPGSGASNSSTQFNPSHVFSDTGWFTVTLIYHSWATGTDTISDLVWIFPQPVLDLGPDTNICGTNSFIKSVAQPYATYLWSTGDTTSSLLIDSAGEYSVTVFGHCDTLIDSLEVVETPIQTGIIFSQQQNGFVTLSVLSGYGYVWSTGDTTASIDVYSIGTYSVEYFAENGCKYQAFITITEIEFVGISEVQKLVVDVFPNPANNEVNLLSSRSGLHQLRVYNVNGKVVLTEAFNLSNSEQTTVELKELPPGVYMMTITIGESFTTSKLLIE